MTQKFIDRDGLKVLWNQISLKDYPNNETLMAVIDAIDETKADKDTTLQTIQQNLTSTEKTQALKNLGITASASSINNIDNLTETVDSLTETVEEAIPIVETLYYKNKGSKYTTVTWDGKIGDKENIDIEGLFKFVKVSNNAPSPEILTMVDEDYLYNQTKIQCSALINEGSSTTDNGKLNVIHQLSIMSLGEFLDNGFFLPEDNSAAIFLTTDPNYDIPFAVLVCCKDEYFFEALNITLTKGIYFSSVTAIEDSFNMTHFVSEVDFGILLNDDEIYWEDLKNKPFGEDEKIEILPLTEIDLSDGGMTTSSFGLVEGETYTVNWNGVDYKCICEKAIFEGIEGIGLGNIPFILETGDSGHPFVLGDATGFGVGFIGGLDESESATLSIFKHSFKYLDSKYIKDMYYTDEIFNTDEVLYENDTLNPDFLSGNILFELNVNDILNITINQNEYVAKVKQFIQDNKTISYAGNLFLLGEAYPDTKEPYLIIVVPGPLTAIRISESLVDADSTCNFKLERGHFVENVHTIDPKYLDLSTKKLSELENDLYGDIDELENVYSGEPIMLSNEFELVNAEYIITLGGVEYRCKSILNEDSNDGSGVDAYYIGNLHIANSSNENTGNGEPFVIFGSFYDGYSIMFDSTVTATTIDIKKVIGTTTKRIPAKYVEPPYGEKEVELLPETTVSFSDGRAQYTAIGLVAGEKYIVNWEGTEYTCVAKKASLEGLSGIGIGNVAAVIGTGNTGEPFAIGDAPQLGGCLLVDLTGRSSATFSIRHVVLNKIDNKYIDAEWMATYSEEKKVIFSNSACEHSEAYDVSDEFYSYFTNVNNKIEVTIDGESTICSIESVTFFPEEDGGTQILYVGNLSLGPFTGGGIVDTGESFLILLIDDNLRSDNTVDRYILYRSKEEEVINNVTISVFCKKANAIPEEFVPYIPTKLSQLQNDLYGEQEKIEIFNEEFLAKFTRNSQYGGLYISTLGDMPAGKLNFHENDTLIIVFDGVEYRLSPSIMTFEDPNVPALCSYAAGNLGIIGEGEDTGEPFCILNTPMDGAAVFTTLAGSYHKIKAYKVTSGEIKKIPAEYLEIEAINQNTPLFNLAEMGAPALIADDDWIRFDLDTTALKQAAESGVVRIAFKINFGGAEVTARVCLMFGVVDEIGVYEGRGRFSNPNGLTLEGVVKIYDGYIKARLYYDEINETELNNRLEEVFA